MFIYIYTRTYICCSVTKSHSALCDPMNCSTPGFLFLTIFRVCSNSCTLSRWCYLTILVSLTPFFSCLQSFPASRSCPVSQLFASGGQSIGASASASVLPMIIQDWSPLGLAGLLSLQSKGLSRVSPAPQFKNINSLALNLLYVRTLTSGHDSWKNYRFNYTDLCWQSDVSAF